VDDVSALLWNGLASHVTFLVMPNFIIPKLSNDVVLVRIWCTSCINIRTRQCVANCAVTQPPQIVDNVERGLFIFAQHLSGITRTVFFFVFRCFERWWWKFLIGDRDLLSPKHTKLLSPDALLL
jgi:hypothetical protein